MKPYTLAVRASSIALAAALLAPALAAAQNIAIVNGKPVPRRAPTPCCSRSRSRHRARASSCRPRPSVR
ncbi:hypothetical protein Y694_01347 [Methylibium sp. T29-B]|nr:hypothetical protein Y694_01347 [Methylibium sp. T29-B]